LGITAVPLSGQTNDGSDAETQIPSNAFAAQKAILTTDMTIFPFFMKCVHPDKPSSHSRGTASQVNIP
jgi:hypothetical protein